jgi:hypothetical protein
MKTLDENLAEILELEKMETDLAPYNNCELVECDSEQTEIEKDADFARENIKTLIATGITATERLLTIAKTSQQPREYEVLAQMIKNISEMNKDLLDIHKKKKDLDPTSYTRQNINVDKAVVFTGSTAELLKIIKQNKDEKEE